MKKKHSAFSLMELSITILIISILIAGAMMGSHLVEKTDDAVGTYIVNNVPLEDRRGKYASSPSVSLSPPAGCVGGSVDTDTTSSPAKTVHKFIIVGSSQKFNCTKAGSVEYLIVGGGGGGGAFGGGGGAGGLLKGTSSINAGVDYTVQVGDGGAGETSPNGGGANGQPSSFNGMTAIGGGKGWHSMVASSGGSGGGSGYGSLVRALGTDGQGKRGGAGATFSNSYSGGGGGGSGGDGGDASNGRGGNAGIGTLLDITGSPTYYAVGGPGTGYNSSAVQLTPGTAAPGGSSVGQVGASNTGNGGATAAVVWQGRKGGSGIVVIRY